MATFLITFVIFLTVTTAMAVGYIFQKKSIAGSCGGLGAIGIENSCDCPEPCDKRRRREAKAERAAKVAAWKESQIL